MTILDTIDGLDGFATGLVLDHEELRLARSLIEEQWRAVLEEQGGGSPADLAASTIDRYHALRLPVPHADLWPKRVRMLPPAAVEAILRMSMFQRLAREFGRFAVSDEEGIGRENIYWRLVRPGEASDVGPLHADRWFWELGHGTTPAGMRRIKLWVAVVCEPGRSGLRVVPGSHRRRWSYHGEWRDGRLKPRIDGDESTLGARLLTTSPGEAIVFHDGLLHGGALNRGSATRVSFELTLFVPGSPTMVP